jgi:3-hydroxyacyl-CoA dehydrogenase/3-hydroxy-2-methylbutyryl-CoA dehydrogenase
MKIEGSVALVTGGASGLGAASARSLAGKGAEVAILDLPGSKGPEIAAQIGASAAFLPVDITDDESVAAAIDGLVERFGRLDILVNAAGIAPRGRILNRAGWPYPLEDFRRTLEVNLVGPWNVCRLAALAMSADEPGEDDERGAIVNVTSVAGIEGAASQTAYAASKAAIWGLTLPMARDLAHWGIRVNSISPGAFDTPILSDATPEYMELMKSAALFPHRFGRPEEFAHLAEFLIENSIMNGEVVRIDAGQRIDANV